MSKIKLSKEAQSVADELIANGKQVFINEDGEIFTKAGYAREAGVPFVEYKSDEVLTVGKIVNSINTASAGIDDAKPNYDKMNNETLTNLIADRMLDLREAKTKKEFVAILTEADVKEAEANNANNNNDSNGGE